MRELIMTTALFVLLMVALELPALPARTDVAGAATSPARPIAAAPILLGAGFAVCTADATWRRSSNSLHGPAILYDGKSVDGLSGVAELAGLWNVWSDSRARPRTCWTEQPQVFLFGYEAIAYDAQDLGTASLRVRPAPGYRIVVLTGPIRPEIAIVADQRLDVLEVPTSWVTPPARSLRAAKDR